MCLINVCSKRSFCPIVIHDFISMDLKKSMKYISIVHSVFNHKFLWNEFISIYTALPYRKLFFSYNNAN